LEELGEEHYHETRMRLGFAEGDEESADKIPFLLNYDYIPGALSFDKGCCRLSYLAVRFMPNHFLFV
jgi:folate-binding Fe-S cluster repair protein YgfZ